MGLKLATTSKAMQFRKTFNCRHHRRRVLVLFGKLIGLVKLFGQTPDGHLMTLPVAFP